MLAGVFCFAFRRWAKFIAMAACFLVCGLSVAVLAHTLATQASFTYLMGHFPAPWGNEIRAGALECIMTVMFSSLMILSLLGGMGDLERDIPPKKQYLYYVMICMLTASLMALTYTNDIFTAYVFIDIITICSCSLVMSKPGGKPLIATMLYLIMSLIGSSLLLLSISFLYGITGHLLMAPLRGAVEALIATGSYTLPLFIMFALMTVGLGIKSALYPFHVWLPGAHANATTASSSILSGLIIKCYLFFLIKVICRVLGTPIAKLLHVTDLLFVFGVLGLVIGSIRAMAQRDIKRMLSYSSVAQIGYICIGLGVDTRAGLVAACFHILAHATTKPLLFTAAGGLIQVSGGKKDYNSLRGAGRRAPLAGVAFLCGALSMIGIPLFSGFVSKFYLTSASLGTPFTGTVVIAVMVVSTLLNAFYYLPTLVCLFAQPPEGSPNVSTAPAFSYRLSLVLLIGINLALGVCSQPVLSAISQGLSVFG